MIVNACVRERQRERKREVVCVRACVRACASVTCIGGGVGGPRPLPARICPSSALPRESRQKPCPRRRTSVLKRRARPLHILADCTAAHRTSIPHPSL
eukprot:4787624-Pyramimonas_sp.AAC.1